MNIKIFEIDKKIAFLFIALMALIIIINLFGVSLAVETTSSMKPVLQRGDVIFFKKVDPEEINVGDIIIFKEHNVAMPVAHRVVEVLPDYKGFRTKGDAAPYVDPEIVKPEQIEGKCIIFRGKPVIIPKLGLIKYPKEATSALYGYLVRKKTELITAKTQIRNTLKREKAEIKTFFNILKYKLRH